MTSDQGTDQAVPPAADRMLRRLLADELAALDRLVPELRSTLAGLAELDKPVRSEAPHPARRNSPPAVSSTDALIEGVRAEQLAELDELAEGLRAEKLAELDGLVALLAEHGVVEDQADDVDALEESGS